MAKEKIRERKAGIKFYLRLSSSGSVQLESFRNILEKVTQNIYWNDGVRVEVTEVDEVNGSELAIAVYVNTNLTREKIGIKELEIVIQKLENFTDDLVRMRVIFLEPLEMIITEKTGGSYALSAKAS